MLSDNAKEVLNKLKEVKCASVHTLIYHHGLENADAGMRELVNKGLAESMPTNCTWLPTIYKLT
jgi:hypothetical protein